MQKGRLKRFQTAFFLLLALQEIITACVDAGVAVAVCFGQIFNAVAAAFRLIFAYAAITAQSIHGGTVCQSPSGRFYGLPINAAGAISGFKFGAAEVFAGGAGEGGLSLHFDFLSPLFVGFGGWGAAAIWL
ncbi:hypothetical protein E4U82_19695 [Lentibacillus salicampi]|uniref:Uncharacterized protein n=2 Tax=Lentibacillus salicampi TaxID=175306 RepID=A0A4Y9A664_9BACI|nr:hypothetical protein E4U82_19695 [Lentibacillus salicampi]